METRKRVFGLTGASLAATLGLVASAHADTTFTVDNLGDPSGAGACTAADNDCSLRQAVADANTTDGDDTITFQSGLTGTISLAHGSIVVNPTDTSDYLTIQGPGAKQLTIAGDTGDSIFGDYGGGLEVDDTTLTGGGDSAIEASGADLTVAGSAITSSHAKYGGAIWAENSDVTVQSSTISGNAADSTGPEATYIGGGIDLAANASLEMYASTVAGNSGNVGGGIALSDATASATIVDSTISGNHVTPFDLGAGLQGAYGGGIWAKSGSDLSTYNSIIAGNTGQAVIPANQSPDISGAVYTASSLIGDQTGADITSVPGFHAPLSGDAKLGPLQDNGGPTQTMRPLIGSPVIDQGSGTIVPSTTDQRGFTRPVDIPGIPNATNPVADGRDMGAVEVTVAEDTPAPPPAPPVQPARAKCKKKGKHGKKASVAKKHKKCKKKKHKK